MQIYPTFMGWKSVFSRCQCYPKQPTVNLTPSKTPILFLEEIDKSILRFIYNLKRPSIANTRLKRTKLEVSQLFQNYYKAKLIKALAERQPDQRQRAERSELNSCICGQMRFHKGVKITQWQQDSLLKQNK